jgi:hypothetical protein
MRQHLYLLVKVCPGTKIDILFTDAIKDCVLTNRVYHIKDDAKITNQIINNTQNIINYISNLDTLEKLKQFTSYKNKEIIDIQTKINDMFDDDKDKFINDSFTEPQRYDHTHFLDMIHNVTKAKQRDMDDFCVFYNKNDDRVYMATGTDWENFNSYSGIKIMVEHIIEYCLEYYEVYLIRKIEGTCIKIQEHSLLRESLNEYYAFIASFGMSPIITGKADAQILYNDDDERYTNDIDRNNPDAFRIVDRYSIIFNKIREGLNDVKKKAMVKNVADVIKTTTKTNLRELNNRIMSLLNIDEEFKKVMLEINS